MGGIKNREAKMKANKVFTSGCGGGTKGPAVVDKRGQEQKCPYCDKIYKESGRLKDHITKQHADQAGQEAGTSSGPAGAAPAAQQAAAAPARGPSAGAGPSSAAGPVPAAAPASTIMSINSKAGFYTHKSPSMHLHEWVQREKRIRPRYVPRQVEGGKWTCKVVLPDGKREQDDIVVFLPEQHAADSEQDAREAAAVAALNRVQGDRQLELILPKPYVPLWRALGEERTARLEHEKARRAAGERHKVQQEAQRKRSVLRKPQMVVMSDAKQKLVLSLLRERDAAAAGATRGSVGGEVDAQGLAAVVEQLSDMGFSPQQVQLAWERQGGSSGCSVEALLDWLLVNLPSEQLPQQFTKGSKTGMVGVMARNGAAGSSGNGKGAFAPGAGGAALQSVARLMGYGYSSRECEEELAAAQGDEAAAHARLYARITGVDVAVPPPTPPPADADADAGSSWAEELMVLESIYGQEQFSMVSEHHVRLSLELPDDCPVALRAGAPLMLEASCGPWPAAGAAATAAEPSYPWSPPLLAVSCSALAAGALRHLTRVLAQESERLLGQPMLHDLAARALEESSAMDPDACAAAEAATGPPKKAAAGAADGEGDGDAEGASLERQDSSLVEGFEGLTLEEEGPGEDDAASAAGQQGRRQQQAGGGGSGGGRSRGAGLRGPRSDIDLEAESRRLARRQADLQKLPDFAAMRATRGSLPAAQQRGELLEALARHGVVVVSGATGCGKSTQVPQYILEDAIAAGRGAACNIVVTQPRRISALGLASRVADERGERVGEVVGYSVRLDNRTSALTRLVFCTTGILLRRLLSDPSLERVTHVVLDEVHERSVEIDLLLLLLRDVLARRQRGAAAAGAGAPAPPPLKLVLMSATADAEGFARYMGTSGGGGAGAPAAAAGRQAGGKGDAGGGGGGVGMLSIPGFTFPVREFYLEDVFEMTGHTVGRDSRCARRKPASSGSEQAPGGGGEGGGGGDGGGRQLSGACSSYSQQTLRSLDNVDEGQINYDALTALIATIISRQRREGAKAFLSDWPQALKHGAGDTSGGGAVLVFLPGAPEISRLLRALTAPGSAAMEAAGGRGGLRVLPLHGSLSSADQAKVFSRPPQGVTKVVLATNVAETSITIDDVTVVVDSGRAKEMRHDPERSIQRLQEDWVSRAAAQQRRGRAGRVRPGICFRMFSSEQWARMRPYTEPEMLRSPLESVALLIKGMEQARGRGQEGAAGPLLPGGLEDGASATGVAGVLARCLSPPPHAAVASALRLLRAIGAFDDAERLTPLGSHLNKMPMDPRVAKALVFGCLLGCLDPMLTVTAALAHGRPVFLNTQFAPEGVGAARAALLRQAVETCSDHVALVAAYNAWCRALDKGGRSAASTLCQDCALSESSLEAIQAGRAEYARVLADLGFLDEGRPADAASPRAPLPGSAWLGLGCNRNAGNARFLKAAMCAGFYPSVLRVQQAPDKYHKVEGGTKLVDNDPKDVKFFDRERGRTFMHPSSVNFNIGRFASGWMVFTQMTETTKLFVREASMVPVYALLLFGGEISFDHGRGLVFVDEWAEFRAAGTVAVMVKEVRRELDRLLGAKIEDPSLDLAADRMVHAVEELLSHDGF